MMRGGFLGGGNILRSLTLSPMNAALQQAHQMARARLKAGGTPQPKPAKPDPVPPEFIVPADVADEVAKAIEAKLREQGGPVTQPVLQRRAGGRVVVPVAQVKRLGDGDFARGRSFLHGLVWQIRRRRMQRK